MDQTESSSSSSLGVGEMCNGIDHGAVKAGSAAHETVDRIAGAARPAVDKLADSAHQAVDRVTSFASSAAETFEQKRAQLNTTSAELVESARTYVRTNPIAAVGIAAAIGFMVSRLVKSR